MAFIDDLSDNDVDILLERFDLTDDSMKRRIVAELTIKASVANELLDACRILLMCSLPNDITGRELVGKAREAMNKAAVILGR